MQRLYYGTSSRTPYYLRRVMPGVVRVYRLATSAYVGDVIRVSVGRRLLWSSFNRYGAVVALRRSSLCVAAQALCDVDELSTGGLRDACNSRRPERR